MIYYDTISSKLEGLFQFLFSSLYLSIFLVLYQFHYQRFQLLFNNLLKVIILMNYSFNHKKQTRSFQLFINDIKIHHHKTQVSKANIYCKQILQINFLSKYVQYKFSIIIIFLETFWLVTCFAQSRIFHKQISK